jgi:predicted CXXCH cytochrome family protein
MRRSRTRERPPTDRGIALTQELSIMQIAKRLALVVGLFLPAAGLAAGGHDAVGCSGCHARAPKPNTKYLNPKTKQPYTGATALCFACHQDEANGGQGFAPISQHVSHPFEVAAVNPKIARVPAELLRDGTFGCLGCHDPHPSNTNYKYLRADVGAKGDRVDEFCGLCHRSKADPSSAGATVFTSMDEGRPASPAGKGQSQSSTPAKTVK